MKKIYYVVNVELDYFDEVGSTNGNKTITVYEILGEEPTQFFTLDCLLEDNSEELIQEYLNDNGYGDEDIKIIQL